MIWGLSEAVLETRVPVQIVYLGGGPKITGRGVRQEREGSQQRMHYRASYLCGQLGHSPARAGWGPCGVGGYEPSRPGRELGYLYNLAHYSPTEGGSRERGAVNSPELLACHSCGHSGHQWPQQAWSRGRQVPADARASEP